MIDIGTLSLTKKHRDKVMEALKSNRLSYGKMTNEFEYKFSHLHNNDYGIFTNSGTSALVASLQALKILGKWNDGDQVIIPSVTFTATYNACLHCNLRPVIVDVGKDINLDPAKIEEAITPRTRATMPVHLLGKPAKMQEIIKIAKKHKLKVIEDSCEAMFMEGIGTGDVACFSFYIAHILVTGVGGMAITNNEKLAPLIRSLIFHGRDDRYLQIDDDEKYNPEIINARFRFNYPGYSFRGTEMEAALGLVELENWKNIIQQRQQNGRYLASELGVHSAEYLDNHAFMMFPFFHLRRNELILYLEKKGIATRTIMPLINQPYISKTLDQHDYPMAMYFNRRGLLLPSHQDLTMEDLQYIVKTIKEFQ